MNTNPEFKNKLYIITILLIFIQCSIDKENKQINKIEQIELEQFQQLENNHKTVIPDTEQKGKKLLLCLTFIDKKSKEKIQNKVVKFYTTSNGYINLHQKNFDPDSKIDGIAITDSKGQIFVETFIDKENAQIGLTIFEDTIQKEYEIIFKQFLTDRGEKWITESNEHFLGDLKKTKKGELVSFITMDVNLNIKLFE